MKKTIIIVDDHTLFAKSLNGLIKTYNDFEVLEIFKNGQELVDYLNSGNHRPDLVLLDIKMPVKDGLETMEWLKENYPEQKALALSMEHDENYIIKMIRNGCRGYLLKDIEPDEFFYALQSVINSGYYYSDEVSEAMVKGDPRKEFENLTRRELEFLNHACSEMTYREVAGEMNLSPKTIDNYRESLFEKLEVKSRVGLVLFAIKNNLYQL
ncbi:response regulator transcription factor [Autumnicola edwardsiae]|uniref:Response regulator transcription factor n=1 Tax=Autumnicola edwardsiae TaxID=3075594 RepID=A0ABU3CZU9_9FLAO|nr:response regulator transcription factor [Zunongwangia sp. F297]MDT0651793.1 response regulator transcription factor [Zunongwangia sp. F297]